MTVSAHYRPDPRFPSLGRRFYTVASPTRFDTLRTRYRNQRWAARLGLGELDDAEWIDHFGRFRPLPDNLTEALALPYHGHQFHRYSADLGDGRGFVLAELIFFAVAVLALAHAWTRPDAHPNGRQRHVLLFVFAIIGGSLSDLFFVSVLRLPAFFTLLQLLSYLR